MSERLKILDHHIQGIKEDYSGIEKKDLKFWVEAGIKGNAMKTIVLTGDPMYPDIDQSDNFTRAVEAKIKAVKAVKSGTYESVPDWNSDGSQNFDLICEACVNYHKEQSGCRISQIVKSHNKTSSKS